jgi:ParB-like chromosome segregation protein Spo0J
MRDFGFTNPVLIDDENGIIAGHDRVLAARKLGMAEVPCIELIASRVGHSAGHAGNLPPHDIT